MNSNPDLTDVSAWARQNPELLRINPELQNILGAGAMTSIKPSKHRNIRVKDLDGETYDSGKEAADAANFVRAVNGGEYLLYKHHLRVKLPGGVVMELDHVLINKRLQVEVYETKAWDEKTQRFLMTPEWRNKQKQFEEIYGIKIGVI